MNKIFLCLVGASLAFASVYSKTIIDFDSLSIPGEILLQDSSKAGFATEQGQAQDEQLLRDFVGEWMFSAFIKQPGVEMFAFDKVKIELMDSNIISSEFKNHDIKFILEQDSLQKDYWFTYSFKQSMSDKTLLSIDKIKLLHTEGKEYIGSVTTEKEKIKLEVMIKIEDGKVNCNIEAQEGSGKIFEHKLNFWKEKPKSKKQ